MAPAPAGISSPRATSVRIPEADPKRRYAAASAVFNSGGGRLSMSGTGAINAAQRCFVPGVFSDGPSLVPVPT